MRLPRAHLLFMLGIAAAALVAVVYATGIRFPPPQMIPEPAPTHSAGGALREDEDATLVLANGAIFQQRNTDVFQFRAFTPEPELRVELNSDREWVLEVGNIHPDATIDTAATVTEQRDGLTRRVAGSGDGARAVRLSWRFPNPEKYRFAAIGDTGGDRELPWVLSRAAELGADFVLLLGDFNYGDGEYVNAAKAFNNASIPSYVSIGNHDFYVGFRSLHRQFTRHIGPRNSTFTLGRVQFVNIDTAATFLPADGGVRGTFIRALVRDPAATDTVVFTHKPFIDPMEKTDGSSHRLRTAEGDWLRAELLKRDMKTLLAGHIHIKSEVDDRGLMTYISGQGLAHADFFFERPVAELLIGDVDAGKPVGYHWAPLNMPFESHCSRRLWDDVLDESGMHEIRNKLERVCADE